MGENAAPVINPVRASATKVREIAGLSEKLDTYRRQSIPDPLSDPEGGRRARVKILRRSARDGCNEIHLIRFHRRTVGLSHDHSLS
jgi:hypothetical protein